VKTSGIFGLIVMASVALLQPAQGGSRSSARSFTAAPHYSAPARHFSGPGRSFSNNMARYYNSSPRFSSQAMFRNRVSTSGPRFSANRMTALNPRTFSASNPRLTASRTAALRAQGFNSQGRVLARSSRNWDRSRDHFWHGQRCRWRNNSWVLLDLFPWGYGYGYGYGYPYGAYPYYDNAYYEDGYAQNEYAQSQYDNGNADSSVSQVQAELAREGLYRGAVDGSSGPDTRNAVRRYQRSHGLEVTGEIDRPLLDAMGFQ